MKTVLKILTALAAIVGVAYVIATYGDKIVAWCKNLLASCPFCGDEDTVDEAEFADEESEEVVCEEEAVCEEEPAAEEAVEEAPAEEEPVVEIAENEPVAEEIDFEG